MSRAYDGNLNNDDRNYSDRPQYNQTTSSSPYSPTYSQNPDLHTSQQMDYAQYPALSALQLPPSLTVEDMLFVKKWKQDAFIYRTIPFAMTGWGSLYYHSMTKSIPISWPRFITIGVASYFLGVLSYSNELKLRIQNSSLNTPFMIAARNKFNNLNPNQKSGSEFVTDIGNHPGFDPGFNTGGQNYSDDWKGGDFVPDSHFSEPSQSGSNMGEPVNYGYPQPPSQSPFVGDSMASEPNQKPTLSYDELRARNRGYVR